MYVHIAQGGAIKLPQSHHMPTVRLDPRRPPPPDYYAGNLLTVVESVLERYGDLLTDDERDFGLRITALTSQGIRLLARLLGRVAAREDAVIREDRLNYAEVADVPGALAELAARGFVERCPPMPAGTVVGLLTRPEMQRVFREVSGIRNGTKADHLERILAANPPVFCRWRVGRLVGWIRFTGAAFLDLYRLLFFGDRHQDLTTFVLRDLGVHRYEQVNLSRETRQFPDRETLRLYLDLAAAADEIRTVFATCEGQAPRAPRLKALRVAEHEPMDESIRHAAIADLVKRLWEPFDNRMLERRRSRALNRLGRSLEREGNFDGALACYGRSRLAPARERRMRILHRLGDGETVECLRAEVLESPWAALEADFATRFARSFRRRAAPVEDLVLTRATTRVGRATTRVGRATTRVGRATTRVGRATTRVGRATTRVAPTGIEALALAQLTSEGGVGWHLENHLPMAVFALAYWSWLFAPVEGAFVNAFQTGPVDLYWPDFFASRAATCDDPLDGPLKPRLREMAGAKVGIANRLFSWRRFTPEVVEAVTDNIPESDLRALVEIVREDLSGKRSGFPDLTVIYGPGRYEFVEVKGPGDQLQIHQRLWIEALEKRGLPVRVLRYRRPVQCG